MGHEISRSTVRRILKEQGIGPAPERLLHMPWSKFLRAHWEAIVAADFFTVEVWTRVGLMRYLVFFVLDLSTRRVEIAGLAPAPNGLWMNQVGRDLIDEFSGFLRGKAISSMIGTRSTPRSFEPCSGARTWSRYACHRGARI